MSKEEISREDGAKPAIPRRGGCANAKRLLFNSHLQRLMEARGLSQIRLSEQSGVAIGTIRNLLRGRLERIDRSSTEKLLLYFGCEFHDLYRISWEEDNE